MKLVLLTLGMRQWGTGTLRDEKQTRKALWMLPVTAMTEDSRLRSRKGRPRPTSWVGGLSWETWENGVARIHRTGDQGKEGCTQRELWGSGGGPHGAFSWSTQAYEETIRGWRRPTNTDERKQCQVLIRGPRIIPASAWPKNLWFTGQGVQCSEGSCLSRGKISPRMSTVLIPSTNLKRLDWKGLHHF